MAMFLGWQVARVLLIFCAALPDRLELQCELELKGLWHVKESPCWTRDAPEGHGGPPTRAEGCWGRMGLVILWEAWAGAGVLAGLVTPQGVVHEEEPSPCWRSSRRTAFCGTLHGIRGSKDSLEACGADHVKQLSLLSPGRTRMRTTSVVGSGRNPSLLVRLGTKEGVHSNVKPDNLAQKDRGGACNGEAFKLNKPWFELCDTGITTVCVL